MLVGLLLVLALLVGAAGGVALTRITGDGTSPTAASAVPVPRQDGGTALPAPPATTIPDGTSQAPGLGHASDPSVGPATPAPSADTSAVAAKVVPGVVNINTVTAQGEGAGTGMVLTASGQVLTNNHVVAGATKIVVTDADTGKQYQAKVVGTAPTQDVAVLQLVGASKLGTVKTGDSTTVAAGDAVVALGNAGGRGGLPTVVSGNVVALGRSITASDPSGSNARRLTNLIQVDAQIEPGDSGGPLANANGEVIGINTAASTNGQGVAAGEGYAIPINTALSIVKQIESGRETDVVRIGPRGVLGVQVVPAGAGGALGGATVVGSGASVAGVAPGSGAEKAGVSVGSTITSLDGTPITGADALTSAMDRRKPGDKVTLGWTDPSGQSRTAPVTLIEGPVA